MLDKLPLLRIFIGTLGGTITQVGVFMSLVYYRTLKLPTLDYSACQQFTESMQARCISKIGYGFITDNHWTAILFFTLTVAATLLGCITGKKRQALVVSTITGLICAAFLLNIVESGGRLIAIATLFGYVLGGLIIQRRYKFKE